VTSVLLQTEASWQVMDRATAQRIQLLRGGYTPIPANGKRPAPDGWQKYQPSEAEINTWTKLYPRAVNTGILTRDNPAVDIDVLDANVAQEIQDILWDTVGDNGHNLVRFGNKPKRAILFQTTQPFPKVATPTFISPDQRKHRVEILGDGQQIIAYGTHPDTGTKYTWKSDEPSAVTRDALPHMDAGLAAEFIAKATACMAGHGWTVHGQPVLATATEKKLPEFDQLYGRGGSNREGAYANAALDGCAAELSAAAPGGRNDTLNKLAFRMGTMVARNWICAEEVSRRLLEAANACGLVADDGEKAARDTIKSGIEAGQLNPHVGLTDAAIDTAKGAAEPAPDITPFDTFDARNWQDVPIEPRRWTVPGWIPAGEPGLMSGDGGTGKTRLLLQLATGVAADWPDWIGKLIQVHGPAIVFSAEEKLPQMQSVVWDILGSRGCEFRDLKHGMHFICDEEEVALGKAERDGSIKPTRALLRLEKTVEKIRPAFVMIENAAEVFMGDERVRGPVAAFVRKLLGGLTRPSGAAVALVQHPSVSGLQDGTGRAGTTAWRNAGRWQHNFTTTKSGDNDSDLRQLHLGKINYGRPGEKLQLRWERGVFVPIETGNRLERAAAEAPIDEAFLRCLDAAIAQGRTVSDSAGRNYAPALFENMTEAKGTTKRAFELAMPRLFTAGKIKVQTEGRGGHAKKRLTRA
jgi:RecA-family ATPase